MNLSITIRADAEQALQDVALLSQAAELSSDVRKRLLELCGCPPQVRIVYADGPAAGTASEVRVRLELADGLSQLVAAVRAGDFDGFSAQV